jgi:hypothetical protein
MLLLQKVLTNQDCNQLAVVRKNPLPITELIKAEQKTCEWKLERNNKLKIQPLIQNLSDFVADTTNQLMTAVWQNGQWYMGNITGGARKAYSH